MGPGAGHFRRGRRNRRYVIFVTEALQQSRIRPDGLRGDADRPRTCAGGPMKTWWDAGTGHRAARPTRSWSMVTAGLPDVHHHAPRDKTSPVGRTCSIRSCAGSRRSSRTACTHRPHRRRLNTAALVTADDLVNNTNIGVLNDSGYIIPFGTGPATGPYTGFNNASTKIWVNHRRRRGSR